jgi:hypothetical protein
MADAAWADAPVTARAAADAPKANALRRVMSFMLLSLCWFPALIAGEPCR